MAKPLIDGATVRMNGKDYVIPALTFGQLRRLAPKLQALANIKGTIPTPEQMGDIIELVHAGLSRNYPDLTLEQVEDMIDVANAPSVMLALMGQSGLVPKAGGKEPGEPVGGTD